MDKSDVPPMVPSNGRAERILEALDTKELAEAVVQAIFDACYQYAGRPPGWDNAVPREVAVLCAQAAIRTVHDMLARVK